MNDKPTPQETPSSATPGPHAPDEKPQTRPVAAILADIEAERAALDESFEALRRDLDQTVGSGAQRARSAIETTKKVAPYAVGGIALLLVLSWLARRRSRD